MANNLFADVPAATVAKQTISFASAGFNSSNVHIIYEVGNPLKSWVPDRAINSVTTLTENKGYYIVPKANMDMEAIVAPPLPTGGGGTPAAPTAGVVDDTANTFNWTNNPLFPDVSDYETTVNGGTTWITAIAKPLSVGDVSKAIGQVGVRVKAVGGNSASAGLFNATAFNAAAGIDSDAQAFITAQEAAGATISPASETNLSDLYTALKAAGLFADNISMAMGYGLVNGKSPGTKDLTTINPPTINATGYLFDGVDDYLDTGVVEGDDMPVKEDMTIIIYVKSPTGSCMFGVGDGSNSTYFFPVGGETCIQQPPDFTISSAGTGLYIITLRNNGTAMTRRVTKNGTQVYSSTIASSTDKRVGGLNNRSHHIGCYNNDGTRSAFAGGSVGICVVATRGYSDAEQTAAQTAYMNFINAEGRA